MYIEREYLKLLNDIIANGVEKQDRTGTGTLSVFGRQIRHKMSNGFPLLTTKKMPFRLIATELLWFLRGDTNIKFLVDNNCHIWDGDAYQAYVKKHKHAIRTEGDRSELAIQSLERQLIYTQEEFINKIKTDDEFAKKWGELGPVYGKQWRRLIHHFPKTYPEVSQYEQYIGVKTIDQITNLINDLKTNPDSRRLMVSAWNVGELDQMTLPPCHYGFQVYTRELSLEERAKWLQDTKGYDLLVGNLDHDHIREVVENESPTRAISIMYNARSQDVPLGTPFNIASYALLLSIIAEVTNMVPDEVISNMGDCHIYLNQVDAIKEQIIRNPRELPELKINKEPFDNYLFASNSGKKSIDHLINDLNPEHFSISGYDPHPTIKIPLSN